MKQIKLVILFLFFIIISSFVSAELTDGNIVYYSFDNYTLTGNNPDDLSGEGNDGVNNGADTGKTCKLGQCFNYIKANNDYINLTNITQDFKTISFWFTTNDTIVQEGVQNALVGDDKSTTYFFTGTTTGGCTNEVLALRVNSQKFQCWTQTGNLVAQTWYHAMIVWNSTTSNYTLFLNNVRQTDDEDNGVPYSLIHEPELLLGKFLTSYFDGAIDEFGGWNRSLNSSERASLYNAGVGFNPYAETKFQITAKSYWDSSAINIFTANINGVNYNTTNGTLITTINNSDVNLYNITISSSNRFNETYINYGVGNNLEANLTQSVINISVNKSFSGGQVCNFSLVNGSTTILNTSLCWGLIYPDAGNHTFDVVDNTGVEEYSNDDTTISVSVLDNKSDTLTVFGHNLLIRAVNLIDSSNISTFNISVNAVNFSSIRYFNTTSGLIVVPVIDGDYNVTIESGGYANFNNSVVVSIGNTKVNFTHNFSLYTENSFNITFIDIDTGLVINETNITIEFIGTTNQVNTTSNGRLYVDLFSPSEYTLIYSADGYRQGHYLFTVTNKSYNELSLYMTKTNDTSLVLITVRDQFSKDPVPQSDVTIQRYINGAWVSDQLLKTDFNGQTEGYFVVSTAFYNFLVEKDDVVYFGVINSNVNKKVIYAEDVNNGIVVEIDTNPTTVIPSYQATYNVITSCRFVNTSNSSGYFIYSFDDTNNLQHDASLLVTYGGVSNCTNSVSSTESANMNCVVNVTPSLGIKTFRAVGYLDGIAVEQCYGSLGVDPVRNFNWGIAGWIIGLFLVVIGFTGFADMPSVSIPVGSIMFGLGIVFNLFFGNTALASVILLIFFAFLLGKTPSKGGVDA